MTQSTNFPNFMSYHTCFLQEISFDTYLGKNAVYMSNILAVLAVINPKLRISFFFARITIVLVGILFSDGGSFDEDEGMNVVLEVHLSRQRPA